MEIRKSEKKVPVKKVPHQEKKVPKKMNENISKLKYKYVKIVLKNTLKLHKKSYNIIKNVNYLLKSHIKI